MDNVEIYILWTKVHFYSVSYVYVNCMKLSFGMCCSYILYTSQHITSLFT